LGKDIMDRARALNTLVEAADLTRMIEELMASKDAATLESTLAGIRITTRTIRERILASHEMLSREMVQEARTKLEARRTPSDFANNSNGKPEIGSRAVENVEIVSSSPLRSSLERTNR